MALDFFGLFTLPGSAFAWGLLLGIIPEIAVGMLLWNKRLRKSLRKDVREQLLSDVDEGLLDPAIERATAGVGGQVQELHELITGQGVQEQIEAVEAKLSELDIALGAHLTALNESIQALPEHMRLSAQGGQGVEMRELYKAASAAEEDAVDAYVADLDPTERIAARLDSMEPSADYVKKHPNGAMIIRGVRDLVVDQMRERAGNVITMKRAGGKGRFPTVYGQ